MYDAREKEEEVGERNRIPDLRPNGRSEINLSMLLFLNGRLLALQFKISTLAFE